MNLRYRTLTGVVQYHSGTLTKTEPGMSKKLLFIESSPRKTESITTDICRRFIQRLQEHNEPGESWEIEVLDLWHTKLPQMNGTTMDAKYAAFSGNPLNEEQAACWSALKSYVEQFAAADMIVIALPTWNWGVPYVLKHYVDVVTQPGLTFNWHPERGYIPVLPPRDAVVVTSSGGDYTEGSGNEHEDYAYRYIKMWLSSCMGCRVNALHMTSTAAGPEALDAAYAKAEAGINALAGELARYRFASA